VDFYAFCVFYLVGFGSGGLVGLISEAEISHGDHSRRHDGFVLTVLLDVEVKVHTNVLLATFCVVTYTR
jgi:hypothetical protein